MLVSMETYFGIDADTDIGSATVLLRSLLGCIPEVVNESGFEFASGFGLRRQCSRRCILRL